MLRSAYLAGPDPHDGESAAAHLHRRTGQDVFEPTPPMRPHLPAFNQIEGLVVDRGITMGDLAGTIDEFVHTFFGGDVKSRLRPSYFPFTEPSAEFDISRADGTWLELGGCGMGASEGSAQLRHRSRRVAGLRVRFRHRPPRSDAHTNSTTSVNLSTTTCGS